MHKIMQKAIGQETRLVTAEEFARMPDDNYSYELVQGRLVQMPKPSARHAFVVNRLYEPLFDFVRQRQLGWASTIDMGLWLEHDPDTVRSADVWFIRRDRLPSEMPDTFWDGVADLAVEVRSKTDRPKKLFEKAEEYVHHGCRLVWVIDPKQRLVWEFRPGQPERTLTEADELDGADVVPGFRLPIKQLFE